jgi:signal peptidase I
MSNFLVEAPFVPTWARKIKETIFFIYNGPSMAPLFNPGDILCAQSLVLGDIQAGDVVIVRWRSERNETFCIVHRVISIRQDYLVTQGDNNPNLDEQVVTNDNLVGLVTSFGRQNHVYPIRGGRLGIFYAYLSHIRMQTRNLVGMLIRRLGLWAYRPIRQSGLVAKIWRPAISQIRVMTPNGPLIKYCFGTRTVARWWPQLNYFDVLQPFDLVIPNPEK